MPWSLEEVEAAVADYFGMLTRELLRQPLNKAEHNRRLSRLLSDRSHGSIERKHQNISAILIKADFPWILGYKPLGNYQRLLSDVVLDNLSAHAPLRELAMKVVTEEPLMPTSTDLFFEEPPAPESPGLYVLEANNLSLRNYRPVHVDYFQQEARNRSLGAAGEQLVVQLERSRLLLAGAAKLAEKVEWTSKVKGDGAGYDVLSFENSGKERFIEVKTTGFGREAPFYGVAE